MLKIKLVRSNMKQKSVPPVIRESAKKQQVMMAQAPIKAHSRRMPSLRMKKQGHGLASDETLKFMDGG